MEAIAPDHPAHALWQDLAGRIAHGIEARGAHAARTVVLLPYVQLLPVARRAWAARVQSGFMPRFETSMNWARAHPFAVADHDISFDTGRDVLTAHAWLQKAGLAAHADLLAARTVEAAWQLAPLAAAVAPGQRPAWAVKARAAVRLGTDAPALQLEAAVARVALEWAAASAYATDCLLAPQVLEGVDLLFVLQGLQPEPLHLALAQAHAGRAVPLSLVANAPRGSVALHEAADAEDEAERAAACVVRHVLAGRVPVALAATDRVLTRRVVAQLQEAGVPMRDEQGWKLSTTRSAAALVASLRACTWDASTDAVIDWLKHAPACAPQRVLALERRVRQASLREWRGVQPGDAGPTEGAQAFFAQVQAWRAGMQAARPLAQWLSDAAALLRETGLWQRLEQDTAGLQAIEVLRLDDAQELAALPSAARRMDLQAFLAWVDAVLEGASFIPERADAPVVILPFGQALARPFSALVLPGCDEQRLPAWPDPAGDWTPAQRQALGLPSREALADAQRLAWEQALQAPHVDLLWRRANGQGETLLPSPLVQLLQLEGAGAPASDPRVAREMPPAPQQPPAATGAALPLGQVSASAYEDLRTCPYRFFALRQLGLREADEIDAEAGKQDFGTWVHGALRLFHEALRDDGEPASGRARLLETCAETALAQLRLPEGEFLPFQAGWPAVRDAYLVWLAKHEAQGARFESAESDHTRMLGDIKLAGRIDRVDQLAGGGRLVVDYKTSSNTRERMKLPLEDTQLAFYAALLDGTATDAMYLQIGERGEIKPVPHPDLEAARQQLEAGLYDDLQRIAEGAMLPAHGEGRACGWCAARGLCRKDGWA